MNCIKEFLCKHKKLIKLIIFVITVLFFILPITTRVKVYKNKSYETKNEVALYIYRYHELPDNFFTQDEIYSKYDTSHRQATKQALIDGYNFGGDIYNSEQRDDYKDWIGNYTQNLVCLYECDIYTDRAYLADNYRRGTERLVYTADFKEVFYTWNHYGETEIPGFEKITEWDINKTSNSLWIVFAVWIFSELTVIVLIRIKNNKNSLPMLPE